MKQKYKTHTNNTLFGSIPSQASVIPIQHLLLHFSMALGAEISKNSTLVECNNEFELRIN